MGGRPGAVLRARRDELARENAELRARLAELDRAAPAGAGAGLERDRAREEAS